VPVCVYDVMFLKILMHLDLRFVVIGDLLMCTKLKSFGQILVYIAHTILFQPYSYSLSRSKRREN